MLIRCCSAIGGAREATGVDLVVLSSGLSVESARVPLVATVTLVNRAVHLDAGGIFVGFDKSRDGTMPSASVSRKLKERQSYLRDQEQVTASDLLQLGHLFPRTRNKLRPPR